MATNRLTDKAIQAAKPRSKPYKMGDGEGLYLLVNPNGTKWWRFKYKHQGREKLLSMGTLRDVSLKRAREKRKDARELLDKGIDPSEARKAERRIEAESFEDLAEEWLKQQRNALAPDTIEQLRRRLQNYVYPYIKRERIDSITANDLLRVLRRIESRGLHETAQRVKSLCGRIFRYAVASGHADRDPTADLKGALAPTRTTHFAAITEPRRIGELLRAIDGYQGEPGIMAALRLAPLVFVRPGELRGAEWAEIDLKAAEWRIPAERMKMGREHIVPLSKQAVAILEEIKPLTEEKRLVFTSLRSKTRAMSENTLNAALRRLGYSTEEMTAHGFRTMASTRLNEMGFEPDVIELQLAHRDRNKVRAAYNRAERLQERRRMMQTWADYLDGLKADKGSKVTAIGGGHVG